MSKELHLEITQDKRELLKEEFDKLESFEQKFDFWETKLERNFLLWVFYPLDEINDFMIWPQNTKETEELNKHILECSVTWPDLLQYPNIEKSERLFIDKIEQSKNKQYVIDSELQTINNYINSRKQYSSTDIYELEKNISFIRAFERYLMMYEEIDLTVKLYPTHQLIALDCGVRYAKYREFVEDYLQLEKKQERIELTGEQKVLILHRLGFGNELKKDTLKAKLYEFFIDELKYKSIIRMFPSIKDYETEKNVDTLIDFFRLIELNTTARELEDKLAKLKQKPQRN